MRGPRYEHDGVSHAARRDLLADIRIAARAPLAERDRAVAAAIAPHLDDPKLLADKDCPCCPDRYIRHLLDEGDGYAVVALVWRPGQMSPVHAHHTWCALGVHSGVLTEHFFAPGATPQPTAAHLRSPRRHQPWSGESGRHPPHRQLLGRGRGVDPCLWRALRRVRRRRESRPGLKPARRVDAAIPHAEGGATMPAPC
jgi:hypothetical protein